MEELFGGLLAGGIIFLIFIAYRIRLEQQLELSENIDINVSEEAEKIVETLSIPLEKKLRDAIYDCKQNIIACDKQMTKLCQQQLDLLQDIGKVSHVEVKNKPRFFKFRHPITQQQHFYYERDLNKTIPPDRLERTQQLATQYDNEIGLILTQKELFNRLIDSHQENLDRLNGIKKNDPQGLKIAEHEAQLQQSTTDNVIEKEAIYNQLLLTNIQEELEHQDECLKQYQDLQKKYQIPSLDQHDPDFKIAIQALIEKLELEDPDNSSQA